MAAIRMNRSGLNVGGAIRHRGDIVTVDDNVADYLVPGGHADLVNVTEVDVAVPVVVVDEGFETPETGFRSREVAARTSQRPMRTLPTRP